MSGDKEPIKSLILQRWVNKHEGCIIKKRECQENLDT